MSGCHPLLISKRFERGFKALFLFPVIIGTTACSFTKKAGTSSIGCPAFLFCTILSYVRRSANLAFISPTMQHANPMPVTMPRTKSFKSTPVRVNRLGDIANTIPINRSPFFIGSNSFEWSATCLLLLQRCCKQKD